MLGVEGRLAFRSCALSVEGLFCREGASDSCSGCAYRLLLGVYTWNVREDSWRRFQSCLLAMSASEFQAQVGVL